MSESLPVVQKAQPVESPVESDWQDLETGKWKRGKLLLVKSDELERERAGYEKREQTLKKQIEKIVEQLENSESRFFEMKEQLGNLQLYSVEQLRYDEGRDALRKSIEELLGLSKQ